jgi:hypothetical protein
MNMKKFLIFALAVVLPLAFSTEGESADSSVYKLKDGAVYMSGEKLESEVEVVAVESDIGGNIRHWAILGDDEDGYGVYFFAKDGACASFVAIDGEYSCQGIRFSLDGKRLLLADGSPMRPDVTYLLYDAASMEKKGEFTGIKYQAEWLDPVRFVFTRIEEDTREGAYLNLGYGLRLSVVMFDTAGNEETVLKEATDKQNYSLSSTVVGGAAVMVYEESVKSEADWADEDKIETREIKVEIPAAG